MVLTLMAIATFGLAQPHSNRVPLADTDFVANVAKISRDFMNATEYFVVDPSTGVKPEAKVATELDRMTPWLRKMGKPELAALLEKATWTAYRDATHRVEPLVAECVFNGDKIRWSFGAKNVAILCDLAQPVDVSNADKANAFALDFLGRVLALPDRPGYHVVLGLKSCGGVWGGYVDRLPPETDKDTAKLWEWDTYCLFVTDGTHVLARWVLLEPEDRLGRGKTTGHPSGPVPPKTKSRFDE
jgi:hypothetical protein